MSLQEYSLSRHVYPCCTEDHVVLLDLKRNLYIGVGQPEMHDLASIVRRWPVARHSEPLPEGSGAIALIDSMCASGMLTKDSHISDNERSHEIEPPELALIDGYSDRKHTVSFTAVIYFAKALIIALYFTLFRSLEAIATRVNRNGKPVPTDMNTGSPHTDTAMESARRVVWIFNRIRPWFFTSHDACLLTSFVLQEFLSSYSIRANWVFGIITGPFEAHCWLQIGRTTLNDNPDYVLKFRTILVL